MSNLKCRVSANVVVFWANGAVFSADTVVLWANAVVFSANVTDVICSREGGCVCV